MTTTRQDVVIDAFVDAGLDCRDEGVLAEAINRLIATGALDDLIATVWTDDPRYRAFQKPRVPKHKGCLLGWLRRIGRVAT